MSTAHTIPLWNDIEPDPAARFTTPAPVADVLVIGAGIAGLVTSILLQQQERQVSIIDRGGIGAGESLRSTAHLCNALDDRFYTLARWHGEEDARLAAESHGAAIDWIEQFCRRQSGGCGFRRLKGYLFSQTKNHENLQREHEAAAAAGLEVNYLEDGLPSLPALGSVLEFSNQGKVNIDELLASLAKEAARLGVRFVAGDVVDVEGGGSAVARLRSGDTIRAASIVVATNVPFHHVVKLHTKQAAYRTYVVAGTIDGDSAPDALFWDDGDPYHYVRFVDGRDTSGTRMIMVGGEDHKTGQSEDASAYARLQAWTREHFPGEYHFSHAWSGQIIEPVDGLAFIGRDPGRSNVFIATGDSGNGITHGVIAGLVISDLVLGRDNPWADLYAPDRIPVRAGGGWLAENSNVAVQYLDWLKSDGVASALSLPPGEGAVLRDGRHRIAVYRDGNGEISAFSARCPHLGCVVRWSPQEKSWDCPCHGSRFDAKTGAILNGPADAPLSSIEADANKR